MKETKFPRFLVPIPHTRHKYRRKLAAASATFFGFKGRTRTEFQAVKNWPRAVTKLPGEKNKEREIAVGSWMEFPVNNCFTCSGFRFDVLFVRSHQVEGRGIHISFLLCGREGGSVVSIIGPFC